ncbi:hypothetical protein [Saccharothrix australiensis]|uniref:LPXTG-motif cell wall-anchored protein n=1 Tax=Saccharothrix australiensis TaxID=2072 RepID=A0A495W211_9PSEU|nr:hypothetical protein [Saccharothrix australiensis]RKT55170.1 hypothetical protein C8E97_3828 [Saccharothrix australiensis]
MTCRKLAILTLVACALLLAGPSASAREAVSPPSPEDYAAALDAARAPAAISVAKTNFRQVHGVEASEVRIADRGVAAYVLNPDFVRGAPDAPAGVLQYIAVTATADSGARATLRAGPEEGGRWTVGSASSGDDEEALSKRIGPDSVLLNEPQINGWYELTPTGVVLLQASLPQSPVGAFVPLAEYQRQVRARYGDKLPGSDYQRNQGLGFTQNPAPPTDQRSSDASASDRGPSTAVVLLVVAAVLVVSVGAVLLFRRSRYSHRRSTPTSEGSSPSK